MSIVPTWPIAVGTLVLGLATGAYVDHAIMAGKIDKLNAAHTEELRQREVQRAADEKKARDNERQMTEAIGQVEQDKTDEIAKIRSAAATQLASVQQRPNRQPASPSGVPQATPNCQGATGVDLSRSDAGFLIGEASRADELRTALDACYKAYDAVR